MSGLSLLGSLHWPSISWSMCFVINHRPANSHTLHVRLVHLHFVSAGLELHLQCLNLDENSRYSHNSIDFTHCFANSCVNCQHIMLLSKISWQLCIHCWLPKHTASALTSAFPLILQKGQNLEAHMTKIHPHMHSAIKTPHALYILIVRPLWGHGSSYPW